jgi:hypothetical protein
MTEKDLDEFEKEFGFKLLPTGFKKPLSEITKEEYRERIEYLYNAIINDDSNEDDLQMIEERIDGLIGTYKRTIDEDREIILHHENKIIDYINKGESHHINSLVGQIEILNFEISMFKSFIEALEYAKTGERKVEGIKNA